MYNELSYPEAQGRLQEKGRGDKNGKKYFNGTLSFFLFC